MRHFFILAAALSVSVLAFHCGSDPASCGETRACGGGDGGGVDGGGDGDVVVPADCDLTAEPKVAPKCVANGVGVFVDGASGADGNAGTKESPVKTIGGALGKLGGKSRVYVCEGTYAEHVKLTSAVSLYGGFSCVAGVWSYSGNKAKVAPGDAGYAVEVSGTTSDVTVSDLSLVATNATEKGESSIAVFVQKASKLILLRDELEAGSAKEGSDGAAGTTGAITAVSSGALSASGNPAAGTIAGPVKTCTCSSGGTSAGAGGGAPLGAGAPGTPALGGVAPVDGVGGLGHTSCPGAEPNGTGNNGADAPNAADAPKATGLGAPDATGWRPQAGGAGPNGTPGQGGGGGGGRDATSAGGGGACGGCGGTGGKPGSGGGASVALLSLDSTVLLRGSSLTAKAAGAGGTGGSKGAAATGGSGASGGPTGCGAGDGGRGGDGGSGGGGAGGVSAAVLHKGPAPTNEGSTLTPGAKGVKGTGGTAGGNDGADGQSAETVAIQ